MGLGRQIEIWRGSGRGIQLQPKTTNKEVPSPTASTTIGDVGNGVHIQTTGGAAVSKGPVSQAAPTITPPTQREPEYSASVSADRKTALQSQYGKYSVQLKAAPTRTDLWLQLGIIYKIAGDYSGAITTWTYVAKASGIPNNAVAYGNLGDLYLNFTHDYAKATTSYKSALAITPNDADFKAGLSAAQSHL